MSQKEKKNIFSSHHFLIHKKKFQECKFDENIKSYGYEDVLFEIKSQLDFKYIDNPLYHIGLKKTNNFIEDCESGLKNISTYTHEKKVIQKIKILRYWRNISLIKLDRFIVILFKIFQKRIIENLYSSNPSLFLFQCYKIGYLCQVKIESSKKRN